MFHCQRDSFLTELDTEVVACEQIPDIKSTFAQLEVEEPKDVIKPYHVYKVVLKDTILFPEGGGQPDDRGQINETRVVRVVRDGEIAVHYVISSGEQNGSLAAGQKVHVTLDWFRRHDHMQQHSGQHLITAIADSMFKFSTTSWWLGKEESYIELDTKEITDAQLMAIENEVNKKIRENVPVTVNVVDLNDEKLKTARGRNLPADVRSNIRIVTMGDIESNVCCGTHVSNLSQLQVIKLMYSTKKKSKSYLYFLAGDRAINKFSDMLNREVKLMTSLKVSPKDFVGAVDKLNSSLKVVRKNLSTICKELASIEVERFKRLKSSEIFWHCHRDNVEVDFATIFLREIGTMDDKIVLVSLKTDGNCGQFFLQGGKDVINSECLVKVGEKLSEILDGKGASRGLVYQAKVNKIDKISKAVSAIQPLLSNNV